MMAGRLGRADRALAGDGIAMALRRGQMAAEHTLGCWPAMCQAAQLARGYARAWQRGIGARLGWAACSAADAPPALARARAALLNAAPALARYLVRTPRRQLRSREGDPICPPRSWLCHRACRRRYENSRAVLNPANALQTHPPPRSFLTGRHRARHMAVDPAFYDERAAPRPATFYMEPGAAFRRGSDPACLQAPRRPGGGRDFFVASCTGSIFPGWTCAGGRMGMRSDLRRTCVLGMGCTPHFPRSSVP